MRMNPCLCMASAAAAWLLAAPAHAVDFHGYMRAGVGQNIDGGAATAYGNGGAGHTVGRLGDEVDTYTELGLSEVLYDEDDVQFGVYTLTAIGTREGDIDEQGNSYQGIGDDGPFGGQRASLREAYGKGSFGGYSLWAGKRFHQRKDIHIMDFYYLNNSGYGGGVEDVKLGEEGSLGTLNLAWIQNAEDFQDDYVGGPQGDDWRRLNKLDARLSGFELYDNGSLDLAVIYGMGDLSDTQAANAVDEDLAKNDGLFLTVEHVQGGFLNGFNKAIFQYGTGGYASIGAFTNHGGELMDAVDGDGWRLIDWGVIDPGPWYLGWSVMYAWRDITDFIPTTLDADGNQVAGNEYLAGEQEFYNIVLRPGWKWTKTMSTVVELGYAQQKRDGGSWEDLQKITLAQQWAAGDGFWSRPALRAYVSHFAGDVVDMREDNGDQQNTMVGCQVEAWW